MTIKLRVVVRRRGKNRSVQNDYAFLTASISRLSYNQDGRGNAQELMRPLRTGHKDLSGTGRNIIVPPCRSSRN